MNRGSSGDRAGERSVIRQVKQARAVLESDPTAQVGRGLRLHLRRLPALHGVSVALALPVFAVG